MNRYRGDVKLAPQRPLVQRFDVLKNMLKAVAPGIDLVFGKSIKHERVIGIRGMPKK
jgi:hypothetical protein